MTIEMITSIAVMAVVLFFCIKEIIPPHLAAMAGFALLVMLGLVTQDQMLGVFSSSAPFTIAFMFIITAAIERSGALNLVTTRIGKWGKTSPYMALGSLFLVVCIFSGFVNNTPLVLLIAPMLITLGKDLNIPASKLLMPLSYVAVMTGTITLLGTSTNLVVDDIARKAGLEPFGIFEPAPIGLAITFACVAFMLLTAKFLLPVRKPLQESITSALDENRLYLTEVPIGDDSPHIGKTLAEINLKQDGMDIVDLIRHDLDNDDALRGIARYFSFLKHGGRHAAEPVSQSSIHDVKLKAGYKIVFKATRETMAQIRTQFAGEKTPVVEDANLQGSQQAAPDAEQPQLADILITAASRYHGVAIADMYRLGFYGLKPVAIHRQGRNMTSNIGQTVLATGDVLVLEGMPKNIENFLKDEGISRAPTDPAALSKWKMAASVGCIIAVVAVSAFNIMPIASASMIGAMILMVAKVIKVKDAYQTIQWPILMLIYGMLGISVAFETSGAAKYIVDATLGFVGTNAGPLVVLSCFYILTSFLTEFMSNTATAAILTPLAIGFASSLGVDPRPFVVVVMIAASASFATPIGYQTNTYVYSLGNYRFSDFVKMGLPLNIICWLVSMYVIPKVWPL